MWFDFSGFISHVKIYLFKWISCSEDFVAKEHTNIHMNEKKFYEIKNMRKKKKAKHRENEKNKKMFMMMKTN